jgi:hypothetical protein
MTLSQRVPKRSRRQRRPRRFSLFFLCMVVLATLAVTIIYQNQLLLTISSSNDWLTQAAAAAAAAVWEPPPLPFPQERNPKGVIIKTRHSPLELLIQKRGTALRSIDIMPVDRSNENDDQEHSLHDLDIILWTTLHAWQFRKQRSNIIVTRRDEATNLHERLETVRFRVCRNPNDHYDNSIRHGSNSNSNNNSGSMTKQSVPPCPILPPRVTSSFDFYNKTELFTKSSGNASSSTNEKNKTIQIEVWINTTGTILTSFQNGEWLRGQVQYVSYWDKSQKRHVPVAPPPAPGINNKNNNLGKFVNAIKPIRYCSDPRCPRLCTQLQQRRQEEKEEDDEDSGRVSVLWDDRDWLCKETHPVTQPPQRLFGGVCDCEATCFTPAANAIDSTWPWTGTEQRRQFYPKDEPPRLVPNHTCVVKRNRQRSRPRYACDAPVVPVAASSAASSSSSLSGHSPKYKNNLTLTCPLQAAGMHHVLFLPEAKLVFCVSLLFIILFIRPCIFVVHGRRGSSFLPYFFLLYSIHLSMARWGLMTMVYLVVVGRISFPPPPPNYNQKGYS